jgi:uncharacterized Zn finger protein
MSIDKSTLFSVFNKARAGSAGLDRGRVNRALGYVQAGRVALLDDGTAIVSGNAEPVYYVSAAGCDCPDHLWRAARCKHQIARWLLIRLQEAQPAPVAVPEPVPAVTLEDDIALLWGA